MKSLVFFLSIAFVCNCFAQKDTVYTSFQDAFEQPDSVYHLDLSQKGLKELPKATSLLRNLETLILTENAITEFPEFLCEMNQLKKLDFGHNYLETIPDQISNLKQLEFLGLSWNYTLDESLTNVGELLSLKELKMDGLKIEELPKSFIALSNLRALDLSYNHFSELPKWLKKLPALIRIHLGNNHLSIDEIEKVKGHFSDRANFSLEF